MEFSPGAGNLRECPVLKLDCSSVETIKCLSNLFQNYVDSIKLPDGIDISNPDVDALATWIINLTLTIYSASEIKNDFVLLHGVTSAWSLKEVNIWHNCNYLNDRSFQKMSYQFKIVNFWP